MSPTSRSSASTAPSAPPSPETPRRGFLARLRASWPVYAAWYVLACLAAAGFWAQGHGGDLRALASAFAYLVACSAALTLPGPAIDRLGDELGLALQRRRAVLLVVLIVAAGLVAGTLTTGALWATPPFILLCGNAIWAIDTVDMRIECEHRRSAGAQKA